jgi:uncharacterized membrane protein
VKTVRTAVLVPGPVEAVEALWFDLTRWPAFVDGFAAVAKRDEAWPQSGSLAWDSKPGGRGRVLEDVTGYEPGSAHASRVEDAQLRGTQTVGFTPEGDAVRVSLALEYELKERTPLTPIVDAFFVRRALGDSLRRTLTRFASELAGG